MNTPTHEIRSTSAQSLNGGAVWFKGTHAECVDALPRLVRWASNTSDAFQIVRA